MTKVLHIISDANIGGAGIYLINYLKHRDREKYEISVALPRGSLLVERMAPLGVKLIEIDAMVNKSVDPKAIGILRGVIKSENPDIVHTHGSMSGRIAGRRCGKKVVFTRHTAFPMDMPEKTGLKRAAYRMLTCRYADRIIAVGEPCKDGLVKCGVPADLIDTMVNGCDPAERSAPERAAQLRESLGIKPGTFTAGIIARLEDYKGHIHVLEAAKLLKERERDFKIIIAGTGSMETELHEKAKQLNIENEVIFTGFVSDVAGLLSVLDLQLNASYLETSSLSLIEGFSIGVPAVASDCAGNLLLVKSGVNGLTFTMGDSASLAEKIALCMDDTHRLYDFGKGALRIYRENFTGQVFAPILKKPTKKLWRA
ncbi:MAG: glycosyltransferase family 4 protein [Oscillospiraceae bacterium]|nr:glycosyltransferase family 4 protein [Oscillospiraceae bacterium]